MHYIIPGQKTFEEHTSWTLYGLGGALGFRSDGGTYGRQDLAGTIDFWKYSSKGMISNFATGSLSSLFYHIVIKFDIKIVWNMKIGCGLWGPPFCRHLPTTTIGIISTLQNFRTKNNIPDMLKKPPKVKVSLMSWFRDLWWSSTIFWMNMTESCLFVNWREFYDEYPSYDRFSSYDVCLAHQMVRS